MPPPPPPPPPISISFSATPKAKESIPIVQAGHEYLRNTSSTIHQHRNSLASQLRVFDSRWAQYVKEKIELLDKLRRQKPKEFQKNAEILYDDVKTALDDARRRKILSGRIADEQDSVVPGPPPPSTVFSRTMKALSSIIERVEPTTSRASRHPSDSTRTSGSKLKSVKKKGSRHSMRFRPRPRSREPRNSDRERGHRRYDDYNDHYDDRAKRDHSSEGGKHSDSSRHGRTRRSPSRHRRRRHDYDAPEPPPVLPTPYDQSKSNLPPIYARFSTTHEHQYNDDEPLEPPVAPFATQPKVYPYVQPQSSRNGRSYDYDRQHKRYPDHEYLGPSSYNYRPSYDHDRGYNDRYRADQSHSRSREQDRGRDREKYAEDKYQNSYSQEQLHAQSQDPYRRSRTRSRASQPQYSSTSTPVMPINPLSPDGYIPAPSSRRHLSKSRYPPSYQAQRASLDRASGSGSRSRDYGRDREEGRIEDSGYRSRDYHRKGSRSGERDYGYGRYDRIQNQTQRRSSKGSPSMPIPTPGITIPRRPLVMQSRFKENFSILQSER